MGDTNTIGTTNPGAGAQHQAKRKPTDRYRT